MLARELSDLFTSPPRDFSPTPLWWWSGAPVTRERIRWQMERFAAGGVYNLVVINLAPAGPLEEAVADDPRWFSEDWWARFTDACEVAAELGMRMWFYDQIGFSGANVQGGITLAHPEAAGQTLRKHVLAVHGGRVVVPGGHTVLAAHTADGARVPVRGDGGVAVTDGTVLAVVTTVPTAFDYLDRHAVGLLLDLVHGEFDRRLPQYLGSVIAGSFQDELPSTNAWTPRFAEEFLSRRGYDLLDHLPALFVPTDGAVEAASGGREASGGPAASEAWAAKVRGDYYAVRTELTEEALFRPLGAWHEERGMLIGADQSNPARAGYPTQSTQIYSDYFRTHRWYSAAGSDHEGDSKVHSSMAHLHGHPRVWIESFHSSGWGGTLEDTWDWLLPFLRSGASLYNPHASYFGTAGGWFEWAPPSTDWRQPYWAHHRYFADAVARTTSMMTWGTYDADVALLHPTTVAQSALTLDLPVDHFGSGQVGGALAGADRAQREYLALSGVNNWFESQPGLLDAAGIAFDVIDDTSIQAGRVHDGSLAVRAQTYSTVVLPSTTVLEQETARRLLSLLDDGGRVVAVGLLPAAAAGAAGDDALVRALADHPGLTRVDTPAEAVAAVRHVAGRATSDVPLLVRRDGDHAVALVSGAFPNASAYPLRDRSTGFRWEDNDFDSARYAAARTVTVHAPVAEAEVWNPATSARAPARVRVEDGVSRVEVALDGAPLVLLVWREGPPATAATGPRTPVTSSEPDRDSVVLTGDWTGELVPTMDNSHGDMALPAGAPVARLQIWTMDWAQGDTTPTAWSRTRATFGQRVLAHPPAALGAAPRPLGPAEVAEVLAGRRPLGDATWAVSEYSASRGREKEVGHLGNKGRVLEQFVVSAAPGPGEVTAVRTLVHSERPGPADLVVSAGSAKQIWWNGVETPTTAGHATVARVVASAGTDLLEYRLGAAEDTPDWLAGDGELLRSSFLLVEPGGWGSRPQPMTVGDTVRPDGRVAYRRDFTVPAEVVSAGLVVGAATGLSVLLDSEPVARQQKVEYYESSRGSSAMYFQHDLAAVLTAGDHTLEIVADSNDPGDTVFVDLVVAHASGVTTLVSGDGWTATSGGTTGVTREVRGRSGELASSHVALRTHPLAASRWIGGDPVVGEAADVLHTGDDVIPAAQWYRLTVPSGTVSFTLPLTVASATTEPATVLVDGEPVPLNGGAVVLAEPTRRPVEVLVRTPPVVFDRAGAAWTGPAVVTTVRAPIELAPWPDIGLRSWSGAVDHRREVTVPPGATDVVLDLGRLRGSAQVSVDGITVGTVFCAPFRVPLPDVTGTFEIGVTLHNTLGPFFEESTPTMWVFPTQRQSGLYGPVTLSWVTPP